MNIYTLKLNVGGRYRVTTKNLIDKGTGYIIKKGRKFMATYKGTSNMDEIQKGAKSMLFEHYTSPFVCKLEAMMITETESTIEKIEEVTEISVDDQARDKGCWDEYLTYQTINGKNPRRKFIYKELAK